jgi:hypothetical protein
VPWRNLEHGPPIDCWDFDFGAQSCLGQRDWHLAIDVVTGPLEERVTANGCDNIQVARWSALHTCIAFASETDARTRLNAWRNLDFEIVSYRNPSISMTSFTRFTSPAAATTLSARCGELHPPLHLGHSTGSMTQSTLTGPRFATLSFSVAAFGKSRGGHT